MAFWDGSQWVAETPDRVASKPRHRIIGHVLGAVAEGGMIALLGVSLIAGTAFAAKGGNGGAKTSYATVAVPNGVFGGTVQASTTPGLWVYAACSQGGTVVYQQYVQTAASGYATLQLGPTPMWSGGAASCTGQAGSFSSNGTFRVAGSTTFTVSG